MAFEEGRSPELIREFLSLLEWKRNGGFIELSTDLLKADETLFSIQTRLKFINEEVASLQEEIGSIENLRKPNEGLIPSVQQELGNLEQRRRNLEKEIFVLKRRIDSVQFDSEYREILLAEESIALSNTPRLSNWALCKQLSKKVLEDFENVYSGSIQPFEKSRTTVFICFLAGILILRFISLPLYWIAVLTSTSFYLSDRLSLMHKRQVKNWQDQYVNDTVSRRKRLEEKFIQAKLEQIQYLEQALQPIELKCEQLSSQLRNLQQDQCRLDINLQARNRRLASLEQLRKQENENYQNQIENLTLQHQTAKEKRLLILEEKVQKWLVDDVNFLTDEAMRKARIQPSSVVGVRNALTNEPIRLLSGVTEKVSSSIFVESDIDLNLKLKKHEDLELYVLIGSEDFKSESYPNSTAKVYGVYEFLVIFLCSNFFTYYRCYWNFVRRKAVDEEICEYLYDSIASVKVEERSSTRLKDESRKNVYGKHLTITTKDGKVVRFRAAQHRIERPHSIRLSEVDNAFRAICHMLRQRRIDVMPVENIGDDSN